MKIKFIKDYQQFKANSIHLVNDRFGKIAINANVAVLADEEAKVTEVVVESKCADEEEKKSEVKPKSKPRKSTQSK